MRFGQATENRSTKTLLSFDHLHQLCFHQNTMTSTQDRIPLFKHILIVGANRGIGLGLVKEAVRLALRVLRDTQLILNSSSAGRLS